MKLTRYDGHVPLFSQDMEGRERTLFGSAVQDDDINNQFTPEFLRGWGSVGSTEFPTLQDFNALAYTHNKLLSYLYQAGIPSYTQNEEYYIGSIVQYNKDIYICLRDNPNVLPTDTNAWKRLINVSDMSQEVINNDLLTVTSGAVYRALQPKADLTYVNAELNEKANLTYVNTELGKKADKTYVDTELDKKITGGNVVQTTGQSTTDVMSQKAITENLNKKIELGAEQGTGTISIFNSFGDNMASALTLVPRNAVITHAYSEDARVAAVRYRPIIKGV